MKQNAVRLWSAGHFNWAAVKTNKNIPWHCLALDNT